MDTVGGTEWFCLRKSGVEEKRKIRGQSLKTVQLGKSKNTRPKWPVLFNSLDVMSERASVMDITGEVPNYQWKGLEQLKRN